MADKSNKQPENVPGKWYVDNTCVPCNNCMDVGGVGAVLKYSDDQTHVYFHKQPSTPAEQTAAQAALEICPTGSIGTDGE